MCWPKQGKKIIRPTRASLAKRTIPVQVDAVWPRRVDCQDLEIALQERSGSVKKGEEPEWKSEEEDSPANNSLPKKASLTE